MAKTSRLPTLQPLEKGPTLLASVSLFVKLGGVADKNFWFLSSEVIAAATTP